MSAQAKQRVDVLLQDVTETGDKPIPVGIVPKYLSSLRPRQMMW